MDKTKTILTIILTIIGIILCIELCAIYYDANFNPYALPSFCSVNNLVDCDGVAKTAYSQFMGIPLCLWGMFFYSFVVLMLLVNKLKQIKFLKFLEVFKNPRSYIFCLGTIAFTISMILALISIFEIQKLCLLCFATYFIDLAIAIITKDTSKPFLYEFKQSFSDFKEAISIKKYLISFIIVIVISTGILLYTTLSNILTPQIKQFKTHYEQKDNFVRNENVMGELTAKIVIHEYIDYNCAACYLTNISLRRIMNELNGIMVIQHNLPLDGECNPRITNGHVGSCQMARYALAAKKQGKYWEANEILFDKTPTQEKEIIKLLKQIKGIELEKLKFDANSDEIETELKDEIDAALKQNVEATPTVIINMQKITGNVPYYELKEKLTRMGATEKNLK